MAIFSPKARRMIEAAVAELPDDFQRHAWDVWSAANPDTRSAGDPFTGFQEIPHEAAVAALAALDLRAACLSESLSRRELDEDEACDVEGDISFIKTIEAVLIGRTAARV